MKLYANDKMKIIVIPIVFLLLSTILGIIAKDYFLGVIILATGLLNAWFASLRKSYNFIFGAIYCLASSYIAYINGLYGIFFLSIIVYFPLQVFGWLDWHKNMNNKQEVKVRQFTFKKAIIITLSCVIGSFFLGVLLSKMPGQQLAFLDSSSNAINICGCILLHLRFRECWWVLLFNNTIDLLIWLINTINGNPNSLMMLLVSISYFIINFYGLIKWMKNSTR